MKFLKATLFGVLVLLVGSVNAQSLTHMMNCNQLHGPSNPKITRCENNEVICYISDKGDLFCKFK